MFKRPTIIVSELFGQIIVLSFFAYTDFVDIRLVLF